MAYEVTLPELGGDASDKAVISQWFIHEGDIVSEGDDLLELITDKAAFNVPAPISGTVSEILIHDGEEVSIDDVLCLIEM